MLVNAENNEVNVEDKFDCILKFDEDIMTADFILDYDNEKLEFSFIASDGSSQIPAKIFLKCFRFFNRTKNLEKTLVYDFCVKKVLEIYVQKKDFYYFTLKRKDDPYYLDLRFYTIF